MKLKYIPFHAWVKQQRYQGGVATQFDIEEKKYKMQISDKLTTEQIVTSCV